MTLLSRGQEFKLLSKLIEVNYSSEPGDRISLLETAAEIKRECKIKKSNHRDRPADVVNKIPNADLNRERQNRGKYYHKSQRGK